jgi:uncharacterized coiled-coil protein SlyX
MRFLACIVGHLMHLCAKYMRISLLNICAVTLLAPVSFAPLCAADTDVGTDRMAQLEARLIAMEARLVAAEQVQPSAYVSEARIAELESRLAEAEQETREVKALAATGGNIPSSSILGRGATFDIMANSAWRKLRWTQPEQWEAVRPGISADAVIDALGKPPRSVKSLKPRVDEVFFYETSLGDRNNALRGKVSFRKGQVITVQKPNFQQQTQAR